MKLQTYSDGTRILIREDADGNRVSATRIEKSETTESIKTIAKSIMAVAVTESIPDTMPSLISEEVVNTDEGTSLEADKGTGTNDAGTGTADSGTSEPA